jgi:hypothetical protein
MSFPLALALATALSAASPRLDTVFLANGGRLRGTVVADTPAEVVVQLPDGSFRRLARGEVTRVEYADEPAQVGAPAPAPAAPQAPRLAQPPSPPAAEPPPPAAPSAPLPPPPVPRPRGSAVSPAPESPFAPEASAPRQRRIVPPPAPAARHPVESTGFQLSLAVEGQGPLGRVSRTGPQLRDVVEGEGAVALELGAKPVPELFLGVLVEGAAGNQGRTLRTTCRARENDCITTTGRIGVLARLYLTPGGARTGWVAIGTGVESTSTTAFLRGTTEKVSELTATGWEIARGSLGYDFRLSPAVGVGVYVAASVAAFDTFKGSLAGTATGGRSAHGWLGAGVRAVMFP